MNRRWVVRLLFALGAGLLLAWLPSVLTQGVGPASLDLSSRLGLSSGVGASTFAILFAAGVLTSLTPCVYPLIPITVSVFGARSREHRARSAALSAVYVGGIAVTYSSLGIFAALSGRAFGTALSSPWVVAVLAVFLLALAASMFGAFEMTLPASLESRLSVVRGAGFAHAFGMGLVAGIIAAPCTGPVLAGVLTFVATSRSATLGFWMLFSYALGMGLLFFILGTTSLKLPRSGAWMEAVKTVLGIALVAAAIGLLLPLLPKPGAIAVSPRTVMWIAASLAFAAVLAGALHLSFHGDAREKAFKAAALVLLLGAIGLRLGWLGKPEAAEIAWLHDEKAALQLAQSTGKPLLVDFFADWCAACKELDESTFSDPTVKQTVMDRFVPLKVNGTEETDEVTRLYEKYGVPGLPTVLMMACNEPAQPQCAVPQNGPGRISGYVPPDEMIQRMRSVQ
ncbi:MAG: protein-disulfide reductase DsbD family protein [Myxococcales bacterium]